MLFIDSDLEDVRDIAADPTFLPLGAADSEDILLLDPLYNSF